MLTSGASLGRRRLVVLGIIAVAIFGSACSSSPASIKLDGSPRVPDVEGVVQKASAAGITLDGARTYEVSPKLASFSTYNQRVVSLKSTLGKYVQLGVDDGEVKWLSLIGVVNADEAGHQTVVYQGELVAVRDSRFDFKDGTVLRLANGLTPPKDPLGRTIVVIDAKRHLIQGATFQGEVTTTTRTKKS
ncbi:MAG: hypothetical protein QOF21_303 [Actinomycetota bacterium]|jgi:hypothetical protein